GALLDDSRVVLRDLELAARDLDPAEEAILDLIAGPVGPRRDGLISRLDADGLRQEREARIAWELELYAVTVAIASEALHPDVDRMPARDSERKAQHWGCGLGPGKDHLSLDLAVLVARLVGDDLPLAPARLERQSGARTGGAQIRQPSARSRQRIWIEPEE